MRSKLCHVHFMEQAVCRRRKPSQELFAFLQSLEAVVLQDVHSFQRRDGIDLQRKLSQRRSEEKTFYKFLANHSERIFSDPDCSASARLLTELNELVCAEVNWDKVVGDRVKANCDKVLAWRSAHGGLRPRRSGENEEEASLAESLATLRARGRGFCRPRLNPAEVAYLDFVLGEEALGEPCSSRVLDLGVRREFVSPYACGAGGVARVCGA